MSGKESAGLLMFCRKKDINVLLAHPGGPYFAKKDRGAWTIPKGEVDDGEDPFSAAVREFEEETGITPGEPYIDLGVIKQKGGKRVHAWAFEGSPDADLTPRSNDFEMEWPPKSGRTLRFPEIDKIEFFSIEGAKEKMNPAQVAFLDRLQEKIV